MPYPDYELLKDWVNHSNNNRAVPISWFSFEDFPWNIWDFRADLQSKVDELNDNYFSFRYMSFSYSPKNVNLPKAILTGKDTCFLKFEAVVKSQKKVNKYIDVVKSLIDDELAGEVRGTFIKECIGQDIYWEGKTGDVLKYIEKYYPRPENDIDLFSWYCQERDIDMSKISYSI